MAKKAAQNIAFFPATPSDVTCLRYYHWQDTEGLGFHFSRYWWEEGAARQGVTEFVRKKMHPGPDPEAGEAARAEVLLPAAAPADYANIDFLLRRNEETLTPQVIHAMVQAKVTLSDHEPWHAGYERARGFARKHFAQRFAVIVIAHVPALAGTDGYGNHVHCIVLPRPVSINGFGGACKHLCSDSGHEAALAAWKSHLASEEERP